MPVQRSQVPYLSLYRPRVSCIITCYSEGMDVQKTLLSLCEQTYPGSIEIVPVVDGAAVNQETLAAVRNFKVDPQLYPRRHLRPIAKWQRGGRVSSLNAGLALCSGEIILVHDGDTSFDNNMVSAMVRHFEDPNVPAVAGSLRVRNVWASLTTAMQALEYLLSIHMAKIGLSEWNLVNNVSGAFGRVPPQLYRACRRLGYPHRRRPGYHPAHQELLRSPQKAAHSLRAGGHRPIPMRR